MSFKVFFDHWLSPRRRPTDATGKPTNLAVGALAFDPARSTFYAGAPGQPVALSANIIPAPQIHLSRYANDFPAISVSYLPTANNSWLQKNPEVWLFAYRRHTPNRSSGFVHPTHVSRADDNTALYSGVSDVGGIQTTYTTEFPFRRGDLSLPPPYARVLLTGFNCLEFYWNDATGTRPVPANFPVIKTGATSSLRCPRLNSMRMRFQFRFAIDNPDTTAKEFKLFGPPSPAVYCAPNYSGNYRLAGSPGATTNPRIVGFRAFM
jgi:hypothetical protein